MPSFSNNIKLNRNEIEQKNLVEKFELQFPKIGRFFLRKNTL